MYLFIWPPKVFQRLDKNDKNVLIESPTAVFDTEAPYENAGATPRCKTDCL